MGGVWVGVERPKLDMRMCQDHEQLSHKLWLFSVSFRWWMETFICKRSCLANVSLQRVELTQKRAWTQG